MSEEQHNEETEVEAHGSGHKVDRPQKFSASDEPRDEVETDDEVEGHVMKVSRPKHS
jgi:hypothetical protein